MVVEFAPFVDCRTVFGKIQGDICGTASFRPLVVAVHAAVGTADAKVGPRQTDVAAASFFKISSAPIFGFGIGETGKTKAKA